MPMEQRGTSLWGLLRPVRRRRPAHAPAVRRSVRDGVRLAVAAQGGVRHLFATATPRGAGLVGFQAAEARQAIAATLCQVAPESAIVRQVVFVADEGLIEPCLHALQQGEGRVCPVTYAVRQKPADGAALAIEVWAVARGRCEVEVDQIGAHLVQVRHDDVSWVHCGPVVPRTTSPRVYDRSADAFATMWAQLASRGIRFEQVIRTWLYLGDIVGPESDTQRYMEAQPGAVGHLLGREVSRGSPARDGAGLSRQHGHRHRRSRRADELSRPGQRSRDVRAVPLENPRQTAAFDYAASYSPKSPKFSRAMAVAIGDEAQFFVSGTASITQSETRHLDDAAAQTAETLENIEALISESNLRRHGLPGLGGTLANLALIRVYIKRSEDFAAIRAVCESRLGTIPACYTIADVCRPDLLVEIEAVAFTQRCLP